MKELTKFYEKKTAELKLEHDAWVASNYKMRSIELALSQIESKGDIKISPAEDVLKAEYKREKTYNDKLCTHLHDLNEFVRSIEREAKEYGVEWSELKQIFGY